MSCTSGLLAVMAIPNIPIIILTHFLRILFTIKQVKCFVCPRCPANAVSWCSCIMRRRNSSLSGTYKFPIYLIRTLFSMHSAMVISCNWFFVRIASNIRPGRGSDPYTIVIRSEIQGRPWAGGLSADKCNCPSRFCGFRTTWSIFFNLSSPRSGRSPGLLVKASGLPFNSPGW